MRQWIRRIKAGIGMGLTWAVGWMPIGALTAFGIWVIFKPDSVVFAGRPIGLAAFMALTSVYFGILGFVGGGIFSAVLRLMEGRHRFDQLTLPRFVAWGGLAGLILGGVAALILFLPGLQLT